MPSGVWAGCRLYLTAGVENAALRREWIATLAPHLFFGIPATLFLFLTLFVIQRRTQLLYAEVDRRSIAENSSASVAET